MREPQSPIFATETWQDRFGKDSKRFAVFAGLPRPWRIPILFVSALRFEIGRSLTLRPTIRVGVSGWTYSPWRGKFYPPELPHNRELSYAAGVFLSIEINGTFYAARL